MIPQRLDARLGDVRGVLLAGILLLSFASPAEPQVAPGVELSGAFVGDAMGVVSGGLERDWAGLWNVDLQVSLNGSQVGWPGGRAFVYVLGNGGEDPSRLAGDLQVVNNIEAPETWKLFEAWVEQDFWNGAGSVRAGLYDLNTEFDVLRSAASLVNSSFGIGPDFSQSCIGGPSIFPVSALALRVQGRITERLRLRGAVLDGVPGDPDDPYGTQIILRRSDGALFTGEAEWTLARGRAALGIWGYTREFHTNRARIGVPGADGEDGPSYGAYTLIESRLLSEPDSIQGLDGFLRVGATRGDVHQIGGYIGLGGSYTGLLPGRDRDELALGMAAARNSGEFVAARRSMGAPVERWEVALEATYVLRVARWLAVQPDLQLVLNPGTEPDVEDAWVLGLRVALER